MGRFLWTLVVITSLMHVPFALAMLEACERLGLRQKTSFTATAFALAFGIGLFVGRARKGMYDTRKPRWYVWAVDTPYFIHWCACFFMVVPSLVAALVMPFVGLSRGYFLWLYVIGLGLASYGILYRRWAFQTHRHEIRVPGLPAAFDGFRIAHLSDLHIGTMTPEPWGKRWAHAANQEECDIAVVTGDLATSGTEFYDDIARVVGALKGKHGTFVSMGNHDYFGDGEPLVANLRAHGATVLRNEGQDIVRGDDRLHIAAIDDTWTGRADMPMALGSRTKGTVTLLLAHDPDKFPEAVEHEVEVVLSGHTHGGQVAIPFLARSLSLSNLAHKFTLGIYKQGRSTLYVHPGLGTTGPPVRFGVAPAVTILTLRAEG